MKRARIILLLIRTAARPGLLALVLCAAFLMAASAHAQPLPATGASELSVIWEVKNRFRLFRREADFQRHVAAFRNDGVLGTEQRLAAQSDGRGWARDIVERLCTDRAGRLVASCERDGTSENYLAPEDHRIGVVLGGNFPPGLRCDWSFDDGEGPARQAHVPCEEEIRLRVARGRTTTATVDVHLPAGTQQAATDIVVRDLLIAGLGDSIAAGEGNPDRPVRLGESGFCFRRFGTGTEYYRPVRAGFQGNRSCLPTTEAAVTAAWQRQSARWMSGPCHASLYGYQMRAALALAIEQPHVAVTFLPLACSGATIEAGLLDAQQATECPLPGQQSGCSGSVPGQIATLRDALATARKAQPDRALDLVLLTIGANDVLFSGLVGDIIVEGTAERALFRRSGVIAAPDEAEAILSTRLPGQFARLRAALKPLVGGNLGRVVYVTYGHPAQVDGGRTCNGGRDGFDIHPAFNADPERLRRTSTFVSQKFLPAMKALARCESGVICNAPNQDRMTFVDGHQRDFAMRGFCARSDSDPVFDRQCFSASGDSFRSDETAADEPLACGASAAEFRPYASRARWVRTANDSYFTAMTYPDALPAMMQPADIHDAAWGVLSAVYGGAIHPTAEGHAAMADAALPAARGVLGLPPAPEVTSRPLPPPATMNAGPR